MSDRKGFKYSQKQTYPSNSKSIIDSSHKKTALKGKVSEISQSNRKNLMPEFQRVQAESRQKGVRSKIEMVEASSISESQISSSNVINDSGRSFEVREDEYGYQLPKSYILAMSGLQGAVSQRDEEIKKMSFAYQETKKAKEELEGVIEINNVKLKENQIKITELSAQVKILKESAVEDRRSLVQSEKSRSELETQLSIAKSVQNTEKQAQQLLIRELKKQLEQINEDYCEVKRTKNELKKEAETAKKELEEFKKGQNSYKVGLLAEMKTLNEELNKQNLRRIKAEEEIEVLKKQTELLAEKNVIVQKQQEQRYRLPLEEMTAPCNGGRRESLPKQSSNPYLTQMTQKKTQIAEKWSEIEKKAELINSAQKYPAHTRKGTNGSAISRERSSSRVRSRQNCGQLVSQYRELMRHQKELVGLNYQLEVLEKGLAIQGEDKADLQRNYSKLKRECESKELQIKELKTFLNDPIK